MNSENNIEGGVELRPLGTKDVAEINAWPAYTGYLADLDYALRPNGWLDIFPESASHHRFAVSREGVLLGFTLLADIVGERAEFYIAIHPEHTGQGIGRRATIRTLQIAFHELRLQCVHLKVRPWHQRGIALYENVGFRTSGKKIELIQGEPVQFQIMELNYATFAALKSGLKEP